MSETSIEWTDRSINPIRARLGTVVGHHCEKVSPGCANCYASRLQARFRMPEYRADLRQGVEHFFDASRLQEVLTRRKPTKWFWCDMSDLFGLWVPDEWIDECFATMALTPWHTHQIVTKRPERMLEYLTERGKAADIAFVKRFMNLRQADREARRALAVWPLPNVWLGVSCEDQKTADERIPLLLQTPAAVRFVSAEPLLGGLDLRAYMATPVPYDPYGEGQLNWVIVGGESGPHARPCDLASVRSIVQQCKAGDVACFVKQLGAVCVESESDWRNRIDATGMAALLSASKRHRAPDGYVALALRHPKGGDPSEWPEDLRVREFPRVREAISA